VLEALAHDLKDCGKLELSACFMDGTFVVAKTRADAWDERDKPSGARGRNSWHWR
jgi:hypothetical protein